MGRLFGTDGARGIANTQLSCEVAMNIGRAAALVLSRHFSGKPKVIIGMDTRISSKMLECALTAGLCSVGADVILTDVLPTPAIAYLVKKLNCTAGIVISASHNPYEYNGIKLFDKDGFKLPDCLEEEIEAIVLDNEQQVPTPTGDKIGQIEFCNEAASLYINHLKSSIDVDLKGLKIAIDCSFGASFLTAEKIFNALGAECFILNDSPNGININDKCGSTHMEQLIEFVKKNKCDIGIAFDGDADRCLAVDSDGNVVDGDKIIAVIALNLKQNNALKKDTVVMTVMSNLGFFKFAEKNNIEVKTTKVGDRYVIEEMRKNNYCIGGEQSGHIIFLDYATTGDGQLSALQLLSVMKTTGKSLKQLCEVMESFPQVLINIKTTNDIKNNFKNNEKVILAKQSVEQALGDNGRVLLRASGTEPLVRVMIEGKNQHEIEGYAEKIANVIREL